ncbi:MAG: hypothetical protein WBH03_14345, partial [Cyclobacteriaceae bacterium]
MLIAIPITAGLKNSEERNDTETACEIIENARSKYKSGEITIAMLAEVILPVVKGYENEVISLIDELPFYAKDNFSYALASRMTTPTLYDKGLLRIMSMNLDSVFTFKGEENAKQKARIDAALNFTPKESIKEADPEPVYTSQIGNTFKKAGNFTKYTNEIKGTNMCNVTTLAMQLKKLTPNDNVLKNAAIELLIEKGYTQSRDSLENNQLEDILLKIFIQLGDNYFEENAGIISSSKYGPHQYASGLNHVAMLFPQYVSKAENLSGVTTKDDYTTNLKAKLDAGAAIMLSTKLT